MKDILHDEDQLELLDDILGVKARTVRQIHMRIIDVFPDVSLPYHDLESVYTQ